MSDASRGNDSRQPAPRRGARSHRPGFDSRRRAWARHHRQMASDSARRLLRQPLGSLMTMLAIGIALLLWPTWWALWLAADGIPMA